MTRSGEPYTGGIIKWIKDRSRRKRNVLVEQSNDKGHDQVMYDPNDIVIDLLPSEIVVGYVGEDIEVYFALSPLAGMDLVQSCLNKILRVMKRRNGHCFSWKRIRGSSSKNVKRSFTNMRIFVGCVCIVCVIS